MFRRKEGEQVHISVGTAALRQECGRWCGRASERDIGQRLQYLLRVNLSNLRRKPEPALTRPRYIQTEPGVGYRLWGEA